MKCSTHVKLIALVILSSILTGTFAGCGKQDGSGTIAAVDSSYFVTAGEVGPTMTGVLLKLNTVVDAVDMDKDISVLSNQVPRKVESVYLADRYGNVSDRKSAYIYLTLEGIGADADSLLTMNDEQHQEWSDEYDVSVTLSVRKNSRSHQVTYTNNTLSDVVSQEISLFSDNSTYSGTYKKPLTGTMDELELNWAVYEAETLSGGGQNPLIIWLHGRWEGGTDLSEAILGNQVSALAEDEIQSYFTADDGTTGAYVMLVQTPTYWMDNGNGEESEGDCCSRYTEILMDTILNYLQQNPDVDPSRIYLAGGSNGGYMTVEMLIHYPDFFAAGIPVSAAYSSYKYMKNRSGGYVTDFRGNTITVGSNLSDSDIQALCQTPIWFIQTNSDTVVPAKKYVEPLYKKLLQAGADNCWLSLYDNVTGSEAYAEYNNHWAWIYLFDDSVSYVQDTQTVLSGRSSFGFGFGVRGGPTGWLNSATAGYAPNASGGTVGVSDSRGGTYSSIFAWLNAQSR